METLIPQLSILLIFCLFALGLGSTAAVLIPGTTCTLPRQKKMLVNRQSDGLQLLFALVIYSLLCNALLLIPALLQLAGLPQNWIPELHQLALGACLALSMGLALIGLLSLLRRYGIVSLGWLKQHPFPAAKNKALMSIAISVGAYLVLTQLNVISYDFGLYHLPYVNHLVKFGPEIGLANLHSRFGFYNVQFFGQAPWQLMTGQPTLISPSLNIIFLSSLFLHFAPSIQQQLTQDSDRQSFNASSLILFALALCLGMPNFGSLANFDADFALTISSLILIDVIYQNRSNHDPLLSVAVCTMLPLIKFSGILTIFTAAAFSIGIYFLRTLFQIGYKINMQATGSHSNLFQLIEQRPHAIKKTLAIVVAAWLCMATTNIVQSGYPFYPSVILGPMGSHSVSKAGVSDQLTRTVRDYARFNDRLASASSSPRPTETALSQWLSPFLRSERGRQITTWVSAAVFASLIGFICYLLDRNNDLLLRHTALSLSTLAAIVLMLLFLPPNPRFYSWLGVLAYFVALEMLNKRPVTAILTACLVAASIAARGQRPLLGVVGQPAHHQQLQSIKGLHGWRPAQRNEVIEINRPDRGDKCWAIPSPCSPYRAGIEDPAAVDLLR
jgi:hypothetical protein